MLVMKPVEWFGYVKCVCFVYWIHLCSILNAFHFIILIMDIWNSCVVLIIDHVTRGFYVFFCLIFFVTLGWRLGDAEFYHYFLFTFGCSPYFPILICVCFVRFFAFSLLQSAICILFIRVPHFILWVDYNVSTTEKKRVQRENLANDNEHTKYIKN